jgi:nucleotide-binding universal stress UspA family protein
MKKILVGYDGSEQADSAFTYALDLAGKYNAKLIVLSVASLPEPPGIVETAAVMENAQEYFAKRFATLRAQADLMEVATDFAIVVGNPADQIIHYANEHGLDLIVLGHRGKGLVQRWLMGSVSRRVVVHASCAVLIVR